MADEKPKHTGNPDPQQKFRLDQEILHAAQSDRIKYRLHLPPPSHPALFHQGRSSDEVKNPAASYWASNLQRSQAAGWLTLAAVTKWTCRHVRLARCPQK